MKIQPASNHILIQIKELRQHSQLAIPDSVQLNPYGLVLAIGPKVTEYAVGDKLLFLPNAVIGFEQNCQEVFIIADGCVLGKYVEDNVGQN